MNPIPSTGHHPRRPSLQYARWATLGIIAVFCSVGCDGETALQPDDDAGADADAEMQPAPDADASMQPVGDASPDASDEEDPPVIDRAAVAIGAEYTCFIDDEGTLSCWGDNDGGQLGGPEDAPQPVTVALADVRRVDAYGDTTCAVDHSGNGWCFGRVVPGEPMEGVRNDTPVAVPGAGVTALAVGLSHGCALGFDQVVRCWGENFLGQLGSGEGPIALQRSSRPLPVAELPPATSISVGDSHACALLEDATVRCWGGNFSGQLGRATEDPMLDPSPAAVDVADVLQIDAGHYGTCAVLDGGELRCWGRVAGQDFGISPTRVSDMSGFSSVSVGIQHACALREGEVWCWGENGERQLGRTGDSVEVPQRVEWLDPALSVTAGGGHTCAELQDGSLACWGASRHGQTIVPGDDRLRIDIDVRWDEDGLDLELDGPPLNWTLGMADTRAGEEAWYGESCGGWSNVEIEVCHSVGSSGGRIDSVHPDLDRVADGSTLFDASFAPALTYILRAEEPIRYAFECVVWGDRPDYYSELGCVVR